MVDWGAEEHRIVWTFHHALLDGRSFPLVLREVFALYGAAAPGARPTCRSASVPRVHRVRRGLDLAAAEAYWRTYLSGFTAPTPLVIDRPAVRRGED